MFVSLPAFRFDVPAGLRIAPTAQHWRAMRLFGQMPWFIATFATDSAEEDLARVTICFCWDSDLVAAARGSTSGTLVELACMLPAWCSGTGHWRAEQVSEVLEGRDLDRGGDTAFAFRTSTGEVLAGPFLQVVGPRITGLATVAIVGATQARGKA